MDEAPESDHDSCDLVKLPLPKPRRPADRDDVSAFHVHQSFAVALRGEFCKNPIALLARECFGAVGSGALCPGFRDGVVVMLSWELDGARRRLFRWW